MNTNEDLLSDETKRSMRRVVTTNALINVTNGGDHESSGRKNEAYISESQLFQNAILKARASLGFDGEGLVDEDFLEDYISQTLNEGGVSVTKNDRAYWDAQARFQTIVDSVIKKTGLSSEWDFYIAIYIVNNRPPKAWAFSNTDKIRIEDIDDQSEIVLRLKPGLRREDYIRAWKILSCTLGPAQRLHKPYTNQETNLEIYSAWINGRSYTKLAADYFPAMDKAQARDKVVKIVQREKQRRESGTNLAK